MSPKSLPEEPLLSIGALSRETGVPVETLRTWERRYGYPQPMRRASGHRRYTPETAERLRLVRLAVERGVRPARAVRTTLGELRGLLGGADAGRLDTVRGWIESTLAFDGDALQRGFRRAFHESGALVFVTELAVPFLQEVGARWRRADLQVAHEHFASERMRDFLAAQWRPLADASPGPRVVVAALPGERHSLPLHLGALLLALAGWRPLFLGGDTPVHEIAEAAGAFGARVVLVAVSAAARMSATRADLESLSERLGDAELLVGGAPGRVDTRGLSGVVRLADYDQLVAWTTSAARRTGVGVGS